jgi:GT2 family glycosyltransferase
MASLTSASPGLREDGRSAPLAERRPHVAGKFLFHGEEKLYLRGVTYGPFHPDASGCLYHEAELADRDFSAMAASGINAVRVYTVPPLWLLDAAWRHGLWVMVGIPWEQHITFLDKPETAQAIERKVRGAVRACAAHPAMLCFSVGNEIPASIVRWHGAARIERFLERLYTAVKEEDPGALVTYVNFPPTEYLRLDFFDFLAFNVYLERQERLAKYLARLQTLAGNRPLVMAEVGLDSRRNGDERQSEVLDWQIRTVFSSGCAGVFVFAWTDEWSRGGFEIEDWDFGVTTRDRRGKPALRTIARAFRDTPLAPDSAWPSISVVICSYNGQRTIGQTIAEVLKLDYPNYEVIVVNDGSTDQTPEIAASFARVRVITIPNGGLSAARNIGMQAAAGEIVAYIDDDAYPDPHWLHYVGDAFRSTRHVAIGGPNIPPPGDGPIAEAVANAPGGPIHVLLTDEIAEHIPGCNFAVRRAALERIGGFDPVYRAAGDDVDACWRLQELGTIGFAPAAVVWHHRRNSIRAYWKQQKGYGRAEALLERKWPLKYNAAGHLAWQGRVYGPGVLRAVGGRSRIYQGTWGSALFQSLYEPGPGLMQSLAQTPEWYLLALALAGVCCVGFLWSPLLAAIPLLLAAVGLPLLQAVAGASVARFPSRPRSLAARVKLQSLTLLLFILQPVARLRGRLAFGLTPWRKKGGVGRAVPHRSVRSTWSEKWRPSEVWLERLEAVIQAHTFVQRGGDFDPWDLQVRGGLAGSARVSLAVEEHGAGRQLLRWRVRPRTSRVASTLAAAFAVLSALALAANQFPAGLALLAVGGCLATWMYRDCSFAAGAVAASIRRLQEEEEAH